MYDQRARKNIFVIYFLLVGITLVLWFLAKPNSSAIYSSPIVSLTQLTGLLAVLLVGLNVFLSSRLKVLERVLGGLDKVYQQHRLTGKLAFALMLAHPSFLIVSSSSLWRALETYVFNLSFMPYNYGKLALFSFIILISLTIFARLPFHVWKRTHQLVVIPLVFAALHVATVPSDVAIFIPLRVWILGILISAIGIYIYKIVLYKFVAPHYKYIIKEVRLRGKITELILEPSGRVMEHEPGQFVFVVFNSREVSSEEHHFTISSAPEEAMLRLSIKRSGDFTSTLPKLKPGETATLYGPHGNFGKNVLSTKKETVMVAGGIGITPFLSILNYIKNKNIPFNYKIIYSYKDETDSAYKEELAAIAENKLITHNSSRRGRLTGEAIAEKTGELAGKNIFLCGPRAMMEGLTAQLLKMGVARRNIFFEDFSIKS